MTAQPSNRGKKSKFTDMKKLFAIFVAATVPFMPSAGSSAADLQRPLDIPLVLSANFAELRPNHFHSGVDFKTEGRTGLDVRSAADGYVSAIEVSPGGFGRAVYVTHPSLGLTTVYGHLEAFAPKIERIAVAEQYARRDFSIDLEFAPGRITVSRGEVIGKSGNAGHSGGPHLHMDVRRSADGSPLDPLDWYAPLIKDTSAPYVKGIALYPGESATVDGVGRPSFRNGSGEGEVFTAWGKVYPAIRANDAMDGTSNIYGVKHMALYVDGECVWGRSMDSYPLAMTRAINTLVNYDDLVNRGEWWQWTRIPASCPLPGLIGATLADGAVTIDRERDYKCVYVLVDHYGNRRQVSFTIRGRKTPAAQPSHKGNLFRYRGYNTWREDGLRVEFLPDTFYDDIWFAASKESGAPAVAGLKSAIYRVGERHEPMSRPGRISIRVDNDDVARKSDYCLVRIVGDRVVGAGGSYDGGVVSADLNRFGRYAVGVDRSVPRVIAEEPGSWGERGEISFIATDDLSGVQSFSGEIDGRFVLFEYDLKNARLSYRFDPERVERGKSHPLRLSVTDATVKTAVVRSTFSW